jgi:hypothetical protein
MTLRPTRSEERWLTLARRLRRSSRDLPFSEHTGGWRTASPRTNCRRDDWDHYGAAATNGRPRNYGACVCRGS